MPASPTNFARDGVVLVSVNYRLGALGFLAHPALTRALAERNYSVPTPVQLAVLEEEAAERDLLAQVEQGVRLDSPGLLFGKNFDKTDQVRGLFEAGFVF